MITATINSESGKTYYSTVARGVSYHASCDAYGWLVHSSRLSLGRWNTGSVKRFASVEELAANVRAFRGLDVLVAM